MKDLPIPAFGYIKTHCSNQPAFSAFQMREFAKDHMKLFGQVVLDKNNHVVEVRWKTREFFGASIETEPFDKESIKRIERDLPGLAPFRIVDLFVES